MNKTRIPQLGMLIGTAFALLTTPTARSAEDQETMQAAIQTAQADGAARIAEIAAALRTAGYELEAAKDEPHIFRVVSPRVSDTAPTVNVYLYPVGTTLEQMRRHGMLFSIGRDYNAPGAFAFTASYGQPVFASDLPPIPVEREVLGARVLQERVFAALMEFPDIRTTAPQAAPRPDARQRELSARISRMDTLRRDVALWHAEAMRDQEAMSKVQRHRASTLEALESVLEETIGELQKERLGESAAPH